MLDHVDVFADVADDVEREVELPVDLVGTDIGLIHESIEGCGMPRFSQIRALPGFPWAWRCAGGPNADWREGGLLSS